MSRTEVIATAYAEWRYPPSDDRGLIGPRAAAYENGLLFAPLVLAALDDYDNSIDGARDAVEEVQRLAADLEGGWRE